MKEHKEDTISAWIRGAAEHAEAVEDILLSKFHISREQLDGLWSYVGKKGYPETEESGQFFRSTMIDTDSRLRAARGFGKIEKEASIRSSRIFRVQQTSLQKTTTTRLEVSADDTTVVVGEQHSAG